MSPSINQFRFWNTVGYSNLQNWPEELGYRKTFLFFFFFLNKLQEKDNWGKNIEEP